MVITQFSRNVQQTKPPLPLPPPSHKQADGLKKDNHDYREPVRSQRGTHRRSPSSRHPITEPTRSRPHRQRRPDFEIPPGVYVDPLIRGLVDDVEPATEYSPSRGRPHRGAIRPKVYRDPVEEV